MGGAAGQRDASKSWCDFPSPSVAQLRVPCAGGLLHVCAYFNREHRPCRYKVYRPNEGITTTPGPSEKTQEKTNEGIKDLTNNASLKS